MTSEPGERWRTAIYKRRFVRHARRPHARTHSGRRGNPRIATAGAPSDVSRRRSLAGALSQFRPRSRQTTICGKFSAVDSKSRLSISLRWRVFAGVRETTTPVLSFDVDEPCEIENLRRSVCFRRDRKYRSTLILLSVWTTSEIDGWSLLPPAVWNFTPRLVVLWSL